MKSVAIISSFVAAAQAGCKIVPTGDIPNGNGAKFPEILSRQVLGFHHCDAPLVNDEFAEGTNCGKISCYGPSNHIFEVNAVCTCNDGACNWMKQENPEQSAVPDCPAGCLGSEVYTLSRCRKNYMEGDDGYMTNSGEHYYWPGQRCKKVQCTDLRKPKHAMKNGNVKFWKLIAKSFFECVCSVDDNGSNCVWSELTNDAVSAFNDDIELECAEWTSWSEFGTCEGGKKKRSRSCRVNESSYELKSAQSSSDETEMEAVPGHDCAGSGEEIVDC